MANNIVTKTVGRFKNKTKNKNGEWLELPGPLELWEMKKKYLAIKEEGLDKNLGMVAVKAYQSYLPILSERYCVVNNCEDRYMPNNGIISFEFTKWVQDSEEDTLAKLINVYQVLSKENCQIALIYDRDFEKCTVSLAIANADSRDRVHVGELGEAVEGALRGNFPGVEFKHDKNKWTSYGTPECLFYSNPEKDSKRSVATISTLPSEKSEKYVSQNMEKLLDGVVPYKGDRYTLVLLATPIQNQDEKKLELCDLYSSIAHLAGYESNVSTNESITLTENETDSESEGHNYGGNIIVANAGKNFGSQYSLSVGSSKQTGKSEGKTRSYVDYKIKHTLENLEMQIKRMEESSALGMWDFAAYVISNNPTLTRNVAYSYLSLTQGEESYLGKSAVNIWEYDKKGEVDLIINSLCRLRHPVMNLITEDMNFETGENIDWLLYPERVTPTLALSGKELAYALNFPRKSVSGLPVIESVAFGREVHYTDQNFENDKKIQIGQIMHMRHVEPQPVQLNLNSLALHTFITGSTGAGKTNAILNILDKAHDEGVKYLVIEPAKGEYKYNIGGDCMVYGTNPRYNKLLKINPFSFPENIHILEHIDRLVEILNACWPMYAAMPAVLKDAIERAYIDLGWDLEGCNYIPERFPTFDDLLKSLPAVMEESSYSQDTKSDYAGALITRVKSLTNGINGQILCSKEEISISDLFEENVIIDLSRVSSTETKALIMGAVVMKLQEFKIDEGASAFSDDLKHLTVIEEAHNLLRRTSTEQSQENSNLQGKSVEMITNAIAEMRAYGEGFVIVDQAPCLLDEAVIRNTNTKIVLRLPEQADREMVGKAAALNEAQIEELAKLPMGVAAVYQNNWVESVLCIFDEFTNKKPFVSTNVNREEMQKETDYIEQFLKKIYLDSNIIFSVEDVEKTKKWIEAIKRTDYTKRLLRKALTVGLDEFSKKELAYNLFEGKKIAKLMMDSYSDEEGIITANKMISEKYRIKDALLIDKIREYAVDMITEECDDRDFRDRFRKGGIK